MSDKRLRGLKTTGHGRDGRLSRGTPLDASGAPSNHPRVAMMGDEGLGSALVGALELRGLQANLTERMPSGLGTADLLVQLGDGPGAAGPIDAALAIARRLGAQRIVVVRHGLSLADLPVVQNLSSQCDIPISVVHLPRILTIPRVSARGKARSALAAIFPVVFVSDVADALARKGLAAGDVALLARATYRAGTALHGFVMRLADVLVGLSVLVLGFPIFIGLALAIRRDSPGPAIFAQRRVGRGEKPFTLFKLRTMATGTRQVSTHEVSSASVTRLGAKLRHYKLDELPQAWNLLVGNLTLVGPRPCLPEQHELVRERRRQGVFDIKPGVTGLAQVWGIDMSDPVRLAEIDAAYAAVRGIALDLALLGRTFVGAGRGDRVAQAPRR